MKEIRKINLQLFAEESNYPSLNPNATTSEGLAVQNKTFYDMTLLRAAQPNLIHDQFAQKKPIPKNGGKTIEFRTYASLPKLHDKPLQEGVTPEGQSLSATKIEATVAQYGGYVTLTDMLDLTAIDNNVVEATTAIGRQAGLTCDAITRNILQSGTICWYAPKSDGTEVTSRKDLNETCKLTVGLVKKVVAYLRAHNVPTINGDYVAIIHPYVAYDIMEDPKWEEYHKYTTPENLYKGEIGRIAGVRFVETSEAKIWTSADAPSANPCPENLAVFGCLFFGKEAYGTTEVTGGGMETIVKQLGSGGTSDPLNQRSTVGWKCTKTAEILFQDYMMRVECVSGFSPNAEAN